MQTTLGEAKNEARRLLEASEPAQALRLYEQLLAAVPLDYELRFKIGDVLNQVGRVDEAAAVYRTVALHDIRTGHPLPAIVACQALERLGQPIEDVQDLLARTYGAGSPHLARFAVRPAPIDPATPVITQAPKPGESLETAAQRACQCAVDLTPFANWQQQLHPLPFFSELDRASFIAVLRSLTVHRLGAGALVTRQGEPGTALYLVASGEVRVYTTAADGTERELARLYENTLFGEMALITRQPRSASVAVVEEADLIEVSRDALARVTAQIPAIAQVLDRFTRERLIKNLLSSSPLFTPFTRQQQSDLLRRFEGHQMEPGTEVIREGEPGLGLFVVLAGELEVLRRSEGASQVPLAQLRPGDIFGEMSLINDQATSATVRALTPATVLFLDRTYFERLSAAIPEVASYFEAVALQRARDNTLKLARIGVPTQAVELDDTDVILI